MAVPLLYFYDNGLNIPFPEYFRDNTRQDINVLLTDHKGYNCHRFHNHINFKRKLDHKPEKINHFTATK